MVKPKRSNKHSNVNGTPIKLILNNLETTLLNVSIFVDNDASLFRSLFELISISILNLTGMFLNIVTFQVSALIFVFSLVWLIMLLTSVKEENLIVVKDLGFQFTTRYIVSKKTLFIPYEQVQNAFINEVIFRNKVIYLLTLITKDTSSSSSLVPLFQNVTPRLKCLEEIYRHLKLLLQKEECNEINKNLRISVNVIKNIV